MMHYERPDQWFDDIQEVFGDEFEFVENDDLFSEQDMESLHSEDFGGGDEGDLTKNKSFIEPKLFWRKSKQRKRSKSGLFVKSDKTEKLHVGASGSFITLPIYTLKLTWRGMRKASKTTGGRGVTKARRIKKAKKGRGV